ncbi:MAG: polyphosphate kinase 2 family protein [Verrucomicrobiota bacterium]|nr:polyphosphate kinase 2 family protein [Verrucomicrobiota bacterium]
MKEQKSSDGYVTVSPGKPVRLVEINPGASGGPSKAKAAKEGDKLQERLRDLQEALYAEHRRGLLIVIQAMDTGGKDGAIKKLCAGLDPNGVQLTNFKYPTPEEWDHDFLWRVHHAEPRKGSIGIWNRSHYEDVLVPRVHKQISDDVWRARCDDINAFERLLTRNGVTILKFFLHISKDEQKERLEARLQEPEKLWKFNPGDLKERALWDDYQLAYEAVMNRTSTVHAPWHIIPANHKWSRNLVLLRAVVGALEEMKPEYPKPEFDPKDIIVE